MGIRPKHWLIMVATEVNTLGVKVVPSLSARGIRKQEVCKTPKLKSIMKRCDTCDIEQGSYNGGASGDIHSFLETRHRKVQVPMPIDALTFLTKSSCRHGQCW